MSARKASFIVALILISVAVMVGSASAACISCSIKSSCSAGETDLLQMSSTTNAHASNDGTYTNHVCCSGPAGLSNSCSGGTVILRLSSVNNAHVEQNTFSNYAQSACLSSSQNLAVSYGTACSVNYTCVASISATTNAHIGNCSAYSTKVCVGCGGAADACSSLQVGLTNYVFNPQIGLYSADIQVTNPTASSISRGSSAYLVITQPTDFMTQIWPSTPPYTPQNWYSSGSWASELWYDTAVLAPYYVEMPLAGGGTYRYPDSNFHDYFMISGGTKYPVLDVTTEMGPSVAGGASFTVPTTQWIYDSVRAPPIGFSAYVVCAPLPPLCGNGVLDPGETCDDGNNLENDSCSWDCSSGAANAVCGIAARVYTPTETFPDGDFCAVGSPVPLVPLPPIWLPGLPPIPSLWNCTAASSVSCIAMRSGPVIPCPTFLDWVKASADHGYCDLGLVDDNPPFTTCVRNSGGFTDPYGNPLYDQQCNKTSGYVIDIRKYGT